MTIRDAFAMGYMMGAAFHFAHHTGQGGMDFQEAMKRFDKGNKKNGIPKGYIDPVFGFVEADNTRTAGA